MTREIEKDSSHEKTKIKHKIAAVVLSAAALFVLGEAGLLKPAHSQDDPFLKKETDIKPLFAPAPPASEQQAPPAASAKAAGSGSALFSPGRTFDARYASGKIRMEREISRHEDYAAKTLAAMDKLVVSAAEVRQYWQKRLEQFEGKITAYGNKPNAYRGYYNHTISHWQENASMAETYAVRSQTIGERLAKYGQQVRHYDLPNIKYARQLVNTASASNKTFEMQQSMELSRQSYENVIDLVRHAKELEVELNKIEFIAKADQKKALENRPEDGLLTK
ncbi:MAG: hypothetical protein HY747_01735 [Elusimicrobia bacterium]|nr:hypothetical protein [Elusimicrobiota bacterium]